MGNTALHIASEAGYIAVVKVLVEYGASPLIENKVRRKEIMLSLLEGLSVSCRMRKTLICSFAHLHCIFQPQFIIFVIFSPCHFSSFEHTFFLFALHSFL